MVEETKDLNKEFIKESIIAPSLCDKNAKLSVASAFSVFMDIASMHSDALGIGFWDMQKQNRFWMVAKTRIHFIEKPKFGDKIEVVTSIAKTKAASLIRNYAIKKDGKLLIAGKSEWCVADRQTGSFILCRDFIPDSQVNRNELILADPFERAKPQAGQLLGSYQVQSFDIDVAKHMNNVSYIRAFESLYSTDEWDKLDFSTIEVHYKKQCYENETLDFNIADISNGQMINVLLSDGTIAADIFILK